MAHGADAPVATPGVPDAGQNAAVSRGASTEPLTEAPGNPSLIAPAPAPAEGTPAPGQAPAAGQVPAAGQATPPGQWVYTAQYGWLWMPYGNTYTYVPPDGSAPDMYVYYPSVGWSWVVAPWIWGCGPAPYYGVYGTVGYPWYGLGFGIWYGYAWPYYGWYGWGYTHGGHWVGYHPAAPVPHGYVGTPRSFVPPHGTAPVPHGSGLTFGGGHVGGIHR